MRHWSTTRISSIKSFSAEGFVLNLLRQSTRLQLLSGHAEQICLWLIVLACAAIPISLALTNISLALVAIFWLLSAGRARRWQALRHQPVAWLCAALFAWILVGAAYSTGTPAEINMHIQKFAKLLLAAAMMGILVDPIWRKRCMQAFCLGMSIVLLTQLGEVYWDLPWAATHNQGWYATHVASGDYITQGIMVSFMLGIALWTVLQPSNKGMTRWIWCAATVLCVLSLTHWSEGRTGYILLLLVCLTVLGLRFKGRALWLNLGLVCVLGLTVILTSGRMLDRIKLGQQEVTRSLQNERKFNSLGGRLENYRQSLQLIREKPVWGWGTGSFHGQACRVASTSEFCKNASWHPHNQYLLFGVQGGLIAVGLFVALMAVAASQLWRAPPEQRAVGLAFLVIFAVDSLFNSSLFSARENHFFTVMLAVVLAGLRSPSDKQAT
jgi:O-antigen ligase